MMPGLDGQPGAFEQRSHYRIQKAVVLAVVGLVVLLAGYSIVAGGYSAICLPSSQLSQGVSLSVVLALWGAAAGKGASPIFKDAQHLREVLPRSYFLDQLRRERLRADRSQAPLSIAIFCFSNAQPDRSVQDELQGFLAYLRAGIRETDILGDFGDGRIGLLLTDTDESGRKVYLKKLVDDYGSLPASIKTGTYPDQVFQNLMSEPQDLAEPSPFFIDAMVNHHRFGYALKRSIDVVGAVVGILLSSPLMLVTAIAIKLTSPGPIIFRQARLGKDGVPFVFYKFRSMASNADDRIHREYVTSLITGNVQATNQGNSETPLFKIRIDPRVTRVGRIIRKTSIDELPQFFNVLKGDMSLVGPRPPLPYEAEKYQSWHLRRIFEMKPGITGLWQVEGRSKTSFDDMVRLDLEYIRKCSLVFDLKILLKTVKVVVLGAGAM